MPLSKSKKVLPKQESGCVGVEDGCRPGRVRVKIKGRGVSRRECWGKVRSYLLGEVGGIGVYKNNEPQKGISYQTQHLQLDIWSRD